MSARGRRAPPPSRGPRGGLGAFRARPRAQGLTVGSARLARGRGLSSPPAKRASGRPGGEGAAPAGALRRRVPESLIGRAAAAPEPRGRAKETALTDGDRSRSETAESALRFPGGLAPRAGCPFLVQVLQPSGFCALKIRV